MGDVLSSLALGAGQTAVNQMLTNYNRSKDYQNQKKLMDKQFKQNQEAELNHFGNMIQGAKNAGLNPLSALAADYSPVSSGSPSAGVTASPHMDNAPSVQDLINERLAAAQAEKLEAETENVRANTAKQSQETSNLSETERGLQRANDVNKQIDATATLYFKEKYSDAWKKYVDFSFGGDEENALANTTIGTLMGLSQSAGLDKSYVTDLVQKDVQHRVMNDAKIKDAIAKMPVSQRDNMTALTAQAYAQTSQIRALTKKLMSIDWENAEAQYEKTLQEIQNLGKQRQKITAEVNEIVERADYWDSASKNQISQMVRNYIAGAGEISGEARAWMNPLSGKGTSKYAGGNTNEWGFPIGF